MKWLIKVLGGYTKDDLEKMSLTVDAWRTRAIAAETTSDLYKDILQREREQIEIIRNSIQDRMQQRTSNVQPPEMEPLGNGRTSWPRIRRELERRDQVRSNPPTKEEVHAEISREETQA